ncbi:MAG: hypothetical protein COA65_00155 [Rhodospirillaceae bacterium]|nr:MAG: hypothetical protein COA65_00155 [Rhodospirillaceae bacterium]
MTNARPLFFAVLAIAAIAQFSLTPSGAVAGEWDLSGNVAFETRFFPNSAFFSDQDDNQISPSFVAEPELVYEWGGRANRLTFIPFARWAPDSDQRTHVDVREANWLHEGRGWDLVIGLDRIFWGVTESRHLVDIINQFDGVEDIDDEDKLGQPMVNFRLQEDWGTLSAFVLPGFRERSFPDEDARLRGPIVIDADNPTYDSAAEETHVDFALRWSHVIGDWDIGVSHFHGTSREPRLILTPRPGGQVVFVPHYDQIDQTGLEVQWTVEAWLWKLEAMSRSGHGDRFYATVAGFEYTLYQLFETVADLGLLAEYQYDGRDRALAPPAAGDGDLFLGARLALNDVQSTEALAGAVVDRSSQATLFFVEASRRVGDNWKVELEGRFFFNGQNDVLVAGIRDDDFLTLRLSRFF